VSGIKYQCGWINIWSDPVHFNEFLIANLRIYEHIWYENYDFMSQNFFNPCCHLWKCRYRARVYWNLSYPLSILKVIFLESNPLRFIETLISFIRAYVYICLWSVPVHFNEFWIANIRIYQHIWYENYDFMSQKWEKINQKYWNLSYPLSILKVIFLESNPLRFIETLISFIRAYVYICLS
jgi:hypothetical protein